MLKLLAKEEFLKKYQAGKKDLFPREEKDARHIVSDVANKGDRALFGYTNKFDHVSLDHKSVKVTSREIEQALKTIAKNEPGFLKALKTAAKNIKKYHEKQREKSYSLSGGGAETGLRVMPIDRVGVYVPGGLAAYPSSVLMNVIPAQVAGVAEIVLISPPPISNLILAAAGVLGIKEIYRAGGAQGIGALAFGTESIPRVDKIVGPGNIYVTMAKKAVFGIVGIDKLAGPSEVLIIADGSADPSMIAADLLSQAEHDPHARSSLVSNSKKIIERVQEEIIRQFIGLKRKVIIEKALRANGAAVLVKNIDEAIELSNQVGPEHLQILTKNPIANAKKIKNAGAIFLGAFSPVALGDYIAGPNHVLPTEGTARFSSPLGVWDFVKRQSLINFSQKGLNKVKKQVALLAALEGLDAHAATLSFR
ncbi:MAG: histidinol dehydrogenase [Candidatus Margulisbacteria bacterium]|nr:histidinol dehydrogenase [Candidatus Margulisiibacteriota bacterium]MBU1021939.1 histidinol dehydrogenase [Candidatus Margulisiibacteriota bacterium]MBU1728918.1 histidinol dehydrogenase [Candidatus Margulisiibacteriota bacterium]MBU1954724.1 histidinol dehydrogenase [Candidatus Margulisiibacteriota bacterium]